MLYVIQKESLQSSLLTTEFLLLFQVILLAIRELYRLTLCWIYRNRRKSTVFNFLIFHTIFLWPKTDWSSVRNNNMKHSFLRILVFLFKRLLDVCHSFSKILLVLWVSRIYVVIVRVFFTIINEINTIQVLVDKGLLFLRSIAGAWDEIRNWVLPLKFGFFFKMLCTFVVQAKFFYTKSFA